jgi:hypothetical protein
MTSRFKLGSTTLISQTHSAVGNSADVRSWQAVVRIFIEATNAQRMTYLGIAASAVSGTGVTIATTQQPMNGSGAGTATEDLTSAKTLQITGQVGIADPNLYMYCESAQLLRYAAP